MLTKKRENKEKYLAGRKQVRILSHRLKTWQFDSLIEILDSVYKISSFFHTYYRGFQKRASKKLVGLQNLTDKRAYILWRLISSISIANALEIYETLDVNLKLEHIRGESFYSGVTQITQAEIDLANEIRKLFKNVQPFMEYGVKNIIKDKYGVPDGEYSEEGYDSLNEIDSIEVPGICGNEKFCPAIIMEDGKYHIWNR